MLTKPLYEIYYADNNNNKAINKIKKLLNEKIKLHEAQLEELKEKSDKKRKSDLDKIKETEIEITRLHAEIEVHEEVIFSLTKSISDESSSHKKNQELDKYRSQINKNIKKLNKDQKFFEEKTICPTCEQEIDEAFKKKKLNDVAYAIDEMNGGLGKIDLEIQNLIERIDEIMAINKEIQYINSEITTKNGYIKSHNSFIQHLNGEISEKTEDIDTGKTNLLKREIDEQKNLRTQYLEQKRYLIFLELSLMIKVLRHELYANICLL